MPDQSFLRRLVNCVNLVRPIRVRETQTSHTVLRLQPRHWKRVLLPRARLSILPNICAPLCSSIAYGGAPQILHSGFGASVTVSPKRMRHRSDKSIAEYISGDPRTQHLTPDQLRILIAETLYLIKAYREADRLRRHPKKPPRIPKPPKPRRPPRGRPYSAADIIVAAHMHRCGMHWREIDALFGRNSMRNVVARWGFYTGKPSLSLAFAKIKRAPATA